MTFRDRQGNNLGLTGGNLDRGAPGGTDRLALADTVKGLMA
jgi:hypothetical protein